MNEHEFANRLVKEFNCERKVAEWIARKAGEHDRDRNTGKTIDDWISAMREYGHHDPIRCWNWAVSSKDATDWNIGSEERGENSYKINSP